MHTIDDFLGGKIRLKQMTDGYRATSDAVLLAASFTPKPGQKVLDVGVGTGAVSLCMLARCKNILVTGIDIQTDMVNLATENALLNHLEQKAFFLEADIREKIKDLPTGSFDVVVTNPPFIQEDQVSPSKIKDTAHREENCPLDVWIKQCLRYVNAKGHFVMINRADRLSEILSLLYKKLGDIRIVPIYTKADAPAKRVILIGQKGSKAKDTLETGIVLTSKDGSKTEQAEEVMRFGQALR